MNRKWKLIAVGILGVTIIVVILFSLFSSLKADLLEMNPRDIAQTFKEEGKVIAEKERQIHHIYGGKIKELKVEEGQRVSQGDILLILDTTELEYQIEQLEGQRVSLQGEKESIYGSQSESEIRLQRLIVQQAEQDLESAMNYFNNMELLFEEGAVSKIELDEVRNNLSLARINVEQQRIVLTRLSPGGATDLIFKGRMDALEAQLNLMNYRLQSSSVVAPIDGIISNIQVIEGGIFTPGMASMTVFQEGLYEVEAFVLTREIGNLAVGMKVELIEDKKAGKTSFQGEVKGIAPYAVERISPLGLEEHRVPVKVKPNIPQGMEIFPGYRLDIEFTTHKEENRMVVPKTSLFPYEGSEAAWVVRGGRAEIQIVEKGLETDREVVILEGLEEGDFVILNPQLEGLSQGKRVKQR